MSWSCCAWRRMSLALICLYATHCDVELGPGGQKLADEVDEEVNPGEALDALEQAGPDGEGTTSAEQRYQALDPALLDMPIGTPSEAPPSAPPAAPQANAPQANAPQAAAHQAAPPQAAAPQAAAPQAAVPPQQGTAAQPAPAQRPGTATPPPPPATNEPLARHTLASGETLWNVAQAYSVSEEALLQVNQLNRVQAANLRPGVVLRVPARSAVQPRVAPQGQPQAPPTAAQPSENTAVVEHILVQGDSIRALAQRYQVDPTAILAANGLTPAEVRQLDVGQVLLIPKHPEGVVAPPPPSRTNAAPSGATNRSAAARAQALGLGTLATAQQILAGQVTQGWLTALNRKRTLPGTLMWPVSNGWFARGYGAGDDNYHLAIDIVGNANGQVQAAAQGIVAYAGNELPSYGGLVLLVHPGGWVTVYAHNAALLVQAGQQVARGQAIAQLDNGSANQPPHLHFELMFRGQSCDPTSLMQPGVPMRSGQLMATPNVQWSDPSRRPASVPCHPRKTYSRDQWIAEEQLSVALPM